LSKLVDGNIVIRLVPAYYSSELKWIVKHFESRVILLDGVYKSLRDLQLTSILSIAKSSKLCGASPLKSNTSCLNFIRHIANIGA
jgi:hypothetical protein